jgi:hypothetical protein
MTTPHPDPAKALAAAHPKALRVCRSCRRVIPRSLWASAIGLFVMFGCAHFSLIGMRDPNLGVFLLLLGIAAAGVAAIAFCTFCVAFLLWLLTVFLVFARYSLGQMLFTIVSGAACVTAIVRMSFPVMVYPILALTILFAVVVSFIVRQDPDSGYTPRFITDALRSRNAPPSPGENKDEPQ